MSRDNPGRENLIQEGMDGDATLAYLGLGTVDGSSLTEAGRSKAKAMGFQGAAQLSYCLPTPLTQKSSAQILLSRELCSDCLARSTGPRQGSEAQGTLY